VGAAQLQDTTTAGGWRARGGAGGGTRGTVARKTCALVVKQVEWPMGINTWKR
jgi:hypothetical protein